MSGLLHPGLENGGWGVALGVRQTASVGVVARGENFLFLPSYTESRLAWDSAVAKIFLVRLTVIARVEAAVTICNCSSHRFCTVAWRHGLLG